MARPFIWGSAMCWCVRDDSQFGSTERVFKFVSAKSVTTAGKTLPSRSANWSNQLPVKLRIVPEYSHLIESDPTWRREIGLDARPDGNLVTHVNKTRSFSLDIFHRLRKSITQAFDQLEDRKVNIGRLAAEQKRAPTLFQHHFKIAQIFRPPFVKKVLSVPFRFPLLVLVIKTRADGVMCIVDFLHEVGDGELQLMQPETIFFVAWTKLQARSQVK